MSDQSKPRHHVAGLRGNAQRGLALFAETMRDRHSDATIERLMQSEQTMEARLQDFADLASLTATLQAVISCHAFVLAERHGLHVDAVEATQGTPEAFEARLRAAVAEAELRNAGLTEEVADE